MALKHLIFSNFNLRITTHNHQKGYYPDPLEINILHFLFFFHLFAFVELARYASVNGQININ
jgi:hypothetical protein